MNLQEFKEYCEKVDDNLKTSWDYNKFQIKCLTCNSTNVKSVDDLIHTEGSNCSTCGFESYNKGKIIIKCLSCGAAMQVLDMGEFKND